MLAVPRHFSCVSLVFRVCVLCIACVPPVYPVFPNKIDFGDKIREYSGTKNWESDRIFVADFSGPQAFCLCIACVSRVCPVYRLCSACVSCVLEENRFSG